MRKTKKSSLNRSKDIMALKDKIIKAVSNDERDLILSATDTDHDTRPCP